MQSRYYIGEIEELKGKRALTMKVSGTPNGMIEVQFDDMDLIDPRRPNAPEGPGPKGKSLSFGWHRFPEKYFG